MSPKHSLISVVINTSSKNHKYINRIFAWFSLMLVLVWFERPLPLAQRN